MERIIGSFRKRIRSFIEANRRRYKSLSFAAAYPGCHRRLAHFALLCMALGFSLQNAALAQEKVTLKIANRSEESVEIGIQSVHRRDPAWVRIPAWGVKEVTLVSPDDFIVKARLGRAFYSTPRMPLKKAMAADPSRVLYANRIYGAPEGVLVDGFNFKLGGAQGANGDDSREFTGLSEEQESRLEQEIKRVITGGGSGGFGGTAGSTGGPYGSSGGR